MVDFGSVGSTLRHGSFLKEHRRLGASFHPEYRGGQLRVRRVRSELLRSTHCFRRHQDTPARTWKERCIVMDHAMVRRFVFLSTTFFLPVPVLTRVTWHGTGIGPSTPLVSRSTSLSHPSRVGEGMRFSYVMSGLAFSCLLPLPSPHTLPLPSLLRPLAGWGGHRGRSSGPLVGRDEGRQTH